MANIAILFLLFASLTKLRLINALSLVKLELFSVYLPILKNEIKLYKYEGDN